jgi:hypothetical protein
MELNNQVNELQQATQLTPASDFKIYNMTIIGAGASSPVVNGGADAALALRPWVGPKIFNSIFTDFNERGVFLDTAQGVNGATAVTNGLAQLRNTLWWDFTTGSGNGVIDNTATNLGRNSVATNYWTDTSLTNLIANPQLTSISRTNAGALLDPRPAAGSPAWNAANLAATPGGLASAAHAGAFGSVNWASDWTALGEYGVLTGAGAGNPRPSTSTPSPSQPSVTVARNAGNITIGFISQPGVQYQLQGATTLTGLPGGWTNQGAPQTGTGGPLTFNVPIAAGDGFFRVIVP